MPDIKDSVGEGGTNLVHDVALVQAMLTVIKNAKSDAYLPDYDGKYGPSTKGAIIQFQTDRGLLKPAAKPASVGAAPKAAAPPAAAGEKEGLVAKGSDTLAKMVAALPADYKAMLIIENTRTVYFPGVEADATASAAAIILLDLEPTFRGKVANLVKLMYATHKIVLWVTKSGGRRTFDQQDKQTGTKAGPGESNHNFGRATDIGFNRFQWLTAGGAIVKDEDWWLNKMTKNNTNKLGKAKATELWTARDAIATKSPLGLFNSILDGDDDHLQSFDDHLPNDRALAALLNLVGVMIWEAEHKTPRRYNCDLGLGGKMYNVGRATDIWNLNATVTKAMMAEAMTDALKRGPFAKDFAAKKVLPFKEADIKAADLTKMKQSLKDDFVAAETNWLKWQPVR
jgi:hypothetical protein